MKNLVLLIGNIGKDPEIISVKSGKIAKFSLATTEAYNDKSGEKIKKTEWHNVVCFDPISGIAEKYVKKGQVVCVQGKIHYDSYDKDGVKQYFTQIICSELKILSKFEKPENTREESVNNYESNDLPF